MKGYEYALYCYVTYITNTNCGVPQWLPFVSLPLLLSPVVIQIMVKSHKVIAMIIKKTKSTCQLLQHAEKSKAWRRCRAARFTHITAADAVYYRISDAFTNLVTIITWFCAAPLKETRSPKSGLQTNHFSADSYFHDPSLNLGFFSCFFCQRIFFFFFLQLLMLTSPLWQLGFEL